MNADGYVKSQVDHLSRLQNMQKNIQNKANLLHMIINLNENPKSSGDFLNETAYMLCDIMVKKRSKELISDHHEKIKYVLNRLDDLDVNKIDEELENSCQAAMRAYKERSAKQRGNTTERSFLPQSAVVIIPNDVENLHDYLQQILDDF